MLMGLGWRVGRSEKAEGLEGGREEEWWDVSRVEVS